MKKDSRLCDFFTIFAEKYGIASGRKAFSG